MRSAKRVVVLALVAAAASAGAALSAGGGAITGGVVNVCIHQNGGALVASSSCSGNDSAAGLLTTTGTAANASLLDGLDSSAFVKTGVVAQTNPGFVRLDCGGGTGDQSVALAGFGTLHFYCLPNGGGPAVQIVGNSEFFGFMSAIGAADRSWAPADFPQKLMNLPLVDVPEGFFAQVRQVATSATTLTIHGSVVQEITRPPGPYDILYTVTET